MRFIRAGILGLFLLLAFILPAGAQRRVDVRQLHERIYCVVPMVGSGSYDDPRRPAFAPVPSGQNPQTASTGISTDLTSQTDQPAPAGILAYSYQASDDGQYALVEFVARDRAAFKDILASATQGNKVFERSKNSLTEIQQEFRKYKKNFNLATLGVSLP
jgi:hypothetical protein